LGAHHPLSPAIKLGIRHPRNKERKNEGGDGVKLEAARLRVFLVQSGMLLVQQKPFLLDFVPGI